MTSSFHEASTSHVIGLEVRVRDRVKMKIRVKVSFIIVIIIINKIENIIITLTLILT
jgi:hypothetical protein